MNSIDDNELSITPAGQSGGLFYYSAIWNSEAWGGRRRIPY